MSAALRNNVRFYHYRTVELSKIVQILIDHDFYIDGTLEDNIAWKNHNYDPNQVL